MKKTAFTAFCVLVFLLASAQNCNNWLGLSSYPSYVAVGDLDVPGNQITIEAEINMTQPYGGGPTLGSDIVAKYADPTDANYLLRAQNAQITTSNGFFQTPDACALQLNKTYHLAMVYDGNFLKFYRNGFLMSQIAATGNLVQNNWLTQIGFYQFAFYNTNFIGYINEVRIWNIARTQAQIQAYMNASLPSPATQTGLLAYYTFDNLLNKQGNATWNGTLGGSAAINQINPTCAAFVADNDCCPKLAGNFSGNTICAGDQGLLTFHPVTIPADPPYVITYSDGTNIYIQQNVQDNIPFPVAVQPIANGNYSLISIKDASYCDATPITGETATITVNPNPVLQISNDTSICSGTSLQLQVSGANTYQWTPSAYLSSSAVSNPVASPPLQTRFYVTGTDLQECQAKDSVLVSILPSVVFNPPPDTSVCAGGAVWLNSNNDPKYKYQWSPADYLNDPSSPEPVSTPVQSIQYEMEITDPVCRSDTSFTLQVTVNQNPVVKASKTNDIDCTTGVSRLDATGALYYEWTPASGINDPQIANPEAAIDTTTTFTVTGADQNSCIGTDTVTVFVTSKGKAVFEVPNAFTPNYDGINDCFGITKWGNVTIKEFSIYNRWGQKVFDTRNPSECWNGTFHGQMQDTGGYVYIIKAVSFCGNITRTGTVMLIR